jgi:hypothetical protein
MPGYPSGVQVVGTITLGASGQADSIGSIFPVRSNAPFKNLSITIRPAEDPSPYKVEIFHDGELVETHDYPAPAGRTIAEISTNFDYIFPANTGTDAIPQYQATGYDPQGIPIRVQITNYDTVGRVFEVYACYQILEGCQFSFISQE